MVSTINTDVPDIWNDVPVVPANPSTLAGRVAAYKIEQAHATRYRLLNDVALIGPEMLDFLNVRADSLVSLSLIEQDVRNEGVHHAIEVYFDALREGISLE